MEYWEKILRARGNVAGAEFAGQRRADAGPEAFDREGRLKKG